MVGLMATVPTGKMERELRKLYLMWVEGLKPGDNLSKKIDTFQKTSLALVERMGGDVARLGALAGFPAPKKLDLSPHIGTIYSDMKQAAIQAGIATGLNAKVVARTMLKTGMDKSYHRLERLARTETVSAYWKNQWDSVADLGLVMVWSSETGPRTCDFCLSRDGLVVEDSSIRDHPNGRCTLLPMLPSMVDYKGTLQADGSVVMDPKWSTHKPQQPEPMPIEQVVDGVDALDDYRVNSFQMNDDLRSGAKPTPAVKALDTLISKHSLVEPTSIRRILSGDAADKALAMARNGKAYQDKAFMSFQKTSHATTADAVSDYANMGGDIVQIMLKVGPNTPALDVTSLLGTTSSAFYDEGEVLLPRGTRLILDKPRKGLDGVWYILARFK